MSALYAGSEPMDKESNMSLKKIAAINALLFFFFWLLILLAGADKPPPPGFVWVVLVDVLSSAVVFWRVPTYIRWVLSKHPARLRRVILEGFAAGMVVAILFVISGRGEPTVSSQALNNVLWFAVLGLIGVLNSVTLYLINAQVARRVAASE
jgi:hypothetical protein